MTPHDRAFIVNASTEELQEELADMLELEGRSEYAEAIAQEIQRRGAAEKEHTV